ncbi:amidohydrolase [Clostridia bacterium]|nr:amidohydrolase [Clostridia bacterium]
MEKKKIDLLVVNTTVVTLDKERRVLYDAAIAVEKGRILEVGDSKLLESKYQADEVLNGLNKTVFPGFVNTHSHLFQGAMKGLGRDKSLFDWLDSSVRFALHETGYEEVYAAAVVGAIENLRSGSTTVLDYHYAHAKERGMDDAVTQAFEDVGIRGILGRAHTKVGKMPEGAACPHVETEQDFFDDVERLQKKYANHNTISLALAPGIIWDLSEEGYRQCRTVADKYKIPITMHVLETEDDNKFAQDVYGLNTIPFLEKTGVLGPDFIAVHCVDMSDEDFDIFKKHDIKVSHNPVSNMILASGVAPIPRMQKEGLTISLATDGSASNDTQDMIEVIKTSALIHKCVLRDPEVMSASEVLEMASLGGAKAIGRQDDLGAIEEGKVADFWLMNPMTSRCVPVADPVAALVYHSTQQNVDSTVVAGKVILKEGKIQTVDEEAALVRLQEVAYKLRERVGLGNTQWNQKIKVGPFQ